MWYRLSSQGRVITRIPDIEQRLKKIIANSLMIRKNGELHLDFYKLNNFLDENLRQYVNKFWPSKKGSDLGSFDVANKTIVLPYIYDENTFDTLLHEFVHAIHVQELKKLKFQESGVMSGITPNDLKDNFKDFLESEYFKFQNKQFEKYDDLRKDYNKFLKNYNYENIRNAYRDFFNSKLGKKYNYLFHYYRPRLNEKQWQLAKNLSFNVKPDADLYYATNEEMLAYFENAVQFFSVNNLKAVYQEYYKNDIDGFLNYLRDVFSTIGFIKIDGVEQFSGFSQKMEGLINKIIYITGSDKFGGLDKIINAKWWKQLAKNITNNFTQLEFELQSEKEK